MALNDIINSVIIDKCSPTLFDILQKENKRQDGTVELIASENYPSDLVRALLASSFGAKYTEGYPGRRYYGGCQYYDELETYCQDLWKEVFSCPDYYVNVQPHSGTSANVAAITAVVSPGETILSMSLDAGGHLSHCSKVSLTGKLYNTVFYGVDENGWLDMDEVEAQALAHRPKLIICGASAYSRKIPYEDFRRVADEVGAYLLVDMAHIAGLVAGYMLPSPFLAHPDIVTSTTQKTLAGPRGGLIFCTPELAKKIDSAVFPASQGGPLMNVIAAKAACAEQVLQPQWSDYARNVVVNAKAMAAIFKVRGYKILTGGTDNHMFLVDLRGTGLTGIEVQNELENRGITVNKNTLPNDPLPPSKSSGIRIGTAAMTTKGWDTEEFEECAENICDILDKMQETNFLVDKMRRERAN